MTVKLADHLRALPDEGLGALLQLRPDLVVPVPGDISQLASRLQSRVSVRGRWTAWTVSRSRRSTACAWSGTRRASRRSRRC
jgi:hypothetical protein